MGKRIFLILIVWVFWHGLSQDAQFSQFYVSSLYLNPALAGQEGQLYFSSNYRMQWRSIVNPYVSNQVTGIVPIKNKAEFHNHKGGIGATLYSDRAGDGNLKTNGFSVSAAYNLPLAKSTYNYLSFGLQLGFIQKSLDFNNLQWGSQYNSFVGFDANVNPNETTLLSTKIYPDISGGIMWYYNKNKDYEESKWSAYLGASGYHLNQPNESLAQGSMHRLPILLRGHGGLEFKMGPRVTFSPNVLYAYQKSQSQINAGAYLGFRLFDNANALTSNGRFMLGGWCRIKDAYVGSVAFATDSYQIGLSYDMNSSDLRYKTRGRGAYEISLVVRKIKNKQLERFSTPRF
ncbi:MAG TPA: PorP/SprF family type IX secretion system membrane protein [Cytophagales bacterium]|nr:PorP/SprF family type IX secretion system membrane protein [Cytophagales bacterium]